MQLTEKQHINKSDKVHKTSHFSIKATRSVDSLPLYDFCRDRQLAVLNSLGVSNITSSSNELKKIVALLETKLSKLITKSDLKTLLLS